MSRQAVINRLEKQFEDNSFFNSLKKRIAVPTESQKQERKSELYRYINEVVGPDLISMGYSLQTYDNPLPVGGPFMVAKRIENEKLPTVLTYGHCDVVNGLEGTWDDNREPFELVDTGDKYYGRGVVDNKGQHTINMFALKAILDEKGSLGFNSIFLLETSEEIGSPGLLEFCEQNKELLKADVLIASDGPRLSKELPTIFTGTRGGLNFEMKVSLRKGGQHSGNWGGLIANPGVILANAISSCIDKNGHIKVRGILPEKIPDNVKRVLSGLEVDPGEKGPKIDPHYGEPGLTPVERTFAWNTFDVLSFITGNPEDPVNAIPPHARAVCQIRYTVDRDHRTFIPAIRKHLSDNGFENVEVNEILDRTPFGASRIDPDHPIVQWAAQSIKETFGKTPALLPNLGGSLPNNIFTDVLNLVTIWVPHSYAGCSQHGPNEHVLKHIFKEGLGIMGGLFWDAGQNPDLLKRK